MTELERFYKIILISQKFLKLLVKNKIFKYNLFINIYWVFKMLKKALVLGVVIFALMGFSGLSNATTKSAPWQEGQTWGYKWEYDVSHTASSEIGNFSGSVDASGKVAYLYYVKYVGIENGQYRFNFAGSFYAWAHVAATGTSEGASGVATADIKSLWINFDGYFYLVEDEYYDWWDDANYTYYRLTYLNAHIYTKQDIDVSLEVKASYQDSTYSESIAMNGNFDIQIEISFEPGIPFLPKDIGDYIVYEYSYASYDAHVKADLKLTAKEASTGTVTYNFNVNQDYSGSVYFYSSLSVNPSGDKATVEKPAVITNCGRNAMDAFGNPIYYLTRTDPNVDTMVSSLQNSNEAEYDPSTGFYTKQKIGSFDYVYAGNDYSTPTTESEVNEVRENAPAKYGTYGVNLIVYLVIIAIVIVVVLVVVILVAMKRKKAPPAQPTQPMGQQYYPQQYQQYPQQQPPYQQYPPPPPQQQPPPPPDFDQ